MLTLLALAGAGTQVSTACFNGGAFVGAQAGFTHVMLKQEAKAKPIAKADADTLFDNIASLSRDASYDALDAVADKAAVDAIKEFDETTKVATLKVSSIDEVASDATVAKLKGFTGLKSVEVKLVTNAKGKTDFDAAAKTAAAKKVAAFLGKKEDFSKKLVAADGEQKYSSNNGFAGLHAGYLGRVNDKFLAGGLVEGNWVFGQDMKVDKVEQKDTKARFNVNVFFRAMFNLTEKFMAGADLGFSGQEIRQLKAGVAAGTTAKSSDKESKWFWNPAARLVLGVSLTDNVLATAHFGGVFPVMKQDSLDKSVKAKYSNFHGGVGISYVFGG